jgi:hypothetical protein
MKKASKLPNNKQLIKIVLGVILLVVVGFMAYENIVTPSEIALIDTNFGRVVPNNCVNNLDTFNSFKACSESGFSAYSYACKGGKLGELVTRTTCLDFKQAYAQASAICGNTCPTPTPIPVVSNNRNPIFRAREAACKAGCRAIVAAAKRNKCISNCN